MRGIRTIFVTAAVCLLFVQPGDACHVPDTLRAMGYELTPAQMALLAHGGPGEKIPYSLAAPAECVGGVADIFTCENVDLLAHMDLGSIGGGSGNDLWGWVDPQTGTEYALVGRSNGTAFVDLSDPENPVYIGNLPTHTGSSTWRDIKVYEDHAFVVSDFNGNHGIQVFDLNQLRDVTSPPATFTETAHYGDFGSAHNIAINEESGYAYAVGSGTCSGGLHMVDISTPTAPVFAGCYSGDGYTHDVQCVNYAGLDPDHQGKEICFASNEDTVTVVDVTDKANPVQLSRNGYAGDGYTHQGWLTDDHRYFIHDDELDEFFFGHNTRTYVWDIENLDSPTLVGFFEHAGGAIDHNQYLREGLAYQANYQQGLRILSIDDPATAALTQVGFFDTYPEGDGASFSGAWSNYPFFESGIVLVSDINRGLFILRPELGDQPGPIGGSILGMSVVRASCRNLTSGQTVQPSPLNGSWDCSDAGLDAAVGDRVLQQLRGTASGGSIGGIVTGVAGDRLACINNDTGQRVRVSLAASTFDCTAAGLETSSGDRVVVGIWGDVE